MTIRNTGELTDYLISVSAEFAEKSEIHEMAMENGVMKMRRISNGIEIPAGGDLVLKTGGYHLMFMKLSGRLVEGEKRNATLTFKNSGSIDIEFAVEQIKSSKKMDHSDHSDHSAD